MISPPVPSMTEWDAPKVKSPIAPPIRQTQQQQQQQQQQQRGAGGLAKDQELQDPFAEPPQRRLEGRTAPELPARGGIQEKMLNDSSTREAAFSAGSKSSKWEQESQSSTPHLAPRPTPRPRPQSMGVFHPPRITPVLRVDSPHSPAQSISVHHTGIGKSKTPPPVPPSREQQRTSRPASPTRESTVKNPPPLPMSGRPSRPITLNMNIRSTESGEFMAESILHTPTIHSASHTPAMHMHDFGSSIDTGRASEATPIPPPVPNRPERYRTGGKKQPPVPVKKSDNLTVAPAMSDERVSPFSTPPSSPEKSCGSWEELSAYLARRNAVKRASIATSTLLTATAPPLQAPPPPPPPPPQPPLHHPPSAAIHSRASIAAPSGLTRFEASRGVSSSPIMTRASIDSSELRPTLPPRPKNGLFSLHIRKNSLRGRSASPPRASNITSAAFENTPHVGFEPPPQRSHTVKGKSPVRHENGHRSTASIASSAAFTSHTRENYDNEDDSDDAAIAEQDSLSEYPDVSQANRRKPLFRVGPHEIHCKTDVRLFAVSGQYVCTASGSTRVWNVTTGECIMSLSHGETTRITAIAFKPSVNVQDEGKVLWLGTSNGELLEVDIGTQRVVESRASAHTKKEIVKIHRHGYELWTLDEGGKLQVWAPDFSGIPNLRNSPTTFRVNNKHTYSLVVGSQLWIGAGKNVCVYNPSPDSRSDILGRPISPSKPTGDITCGTLVNSEPDKVFFGHSDGKVSIYSRSSFQCIDVVSVSLYKINSMCGVGDFLWTGFKTGMVYVYDVRSRPWRAIKDWQAHGAPVAEVVGDRTSIWKIDRLQVISLGSDNIIKIWDGMLEEDWLEAMMVKHDLEYCSFREIKAVVCTWNAGASKPQDLLSRSEDAAFLENVLTSVESPGIIVFGFQELVDLEDKKLTAKSLLKGGKKKRAQLTQERMSHQYRLWQNQLTKSIETFMPREEPYILLHSANLVGLFTCIFIKQSERNNIRNLSASTVKRGLGGLHGNKVNLVLPYTTTYANTSWL